MKKAKTSGYAIFAALEAKKKAVQEAIQSGKPLNQVAGLKIAASVPN